jgi:hypothetical protein
MEHPVNSRLAPLALAVFLLPITSFAQQQAPDNNAQPAPTIVVTTPPPPATLLENILARKNSIIVKGFTEIATITGEDAAGVRVIAVEVTSHANGDHATGLAIEIHSQGDRTAVSYIDIEEIDGLISAIDYLTKAEASVTQLANYTVQYHTKGDLELSNFSGDGARMIGIKAVQILPTTNQLIAATAFFRVAAMGELRQQIIAGQQSLEKIQAPGR